MIEKAINAGFIIKKDGVPLRAVRSKLNAMVWIDREINNEKKEQQ